MSDHSAVIATDLFDPPLLPGSGKSHIVSLVTRRRVLLDGRYFAGAYVAPLTEDRMELMRDPQQLVERTDFLVISPQLWQSSDVLRQLNLRVETADCVVLQRRAQWSTQAVFAGFGSTSLSGDCHDRPCRGNGCVVAFVTAVVNA